MMTSIMSSISNRLLRFYRITVKIIAVEDYHDLDFEIFHLLIIEVVYIIDSF